MTQTPFDARALIDLKRVGAVAPSPDGTWLAVAVDRLDVEERSRYISDLWRVPLDGSGDAWRLTHGESNDRAPAFRHDGALLFLSDRPSQGKKPAADTPKRTQVWALESFGEATQVTDEPLGVTAFAAARSAPVLAVFADRLPHVPEGAQRATADMRAKAGPSARVYTRMPVRSWDHWIPDMAPHVVLYKGGTSNVVTTNADAYRYRSAHLSISDDGSRVVALRADPCPVDRLDEHTIEVLDVETMVWRDAFHTPRAMCTPPHIDAQGSSCVFMRRTRADGALATHELMHVNLDTGDERTLHDGEDVFLTPHALTPDGEYVLATGDLAATTPVFLVHVGSASVRRLTHEQARGTHTALSVFERAGALCVTGIRSTLTHPPEPFVAALSPAAAPELPARISGFDAAELVTIE
ncbi:MAG: hypothetical protein AAGI01_17555, partial [Myxococcota bacterium]